MDSRTKKLTILGMFSAIAYVLTYISTLIPISVAGFLKYDPKDIIIVIAGFILGPASSFVISLVVSLIEAVTISTTGFIGFIMNVLSTASFACTASIIYKKRRTLGGAIIGLLSGTLLMCGVMILWNYLITPLYMSVTRDVVEAMLLPIFLPFNLIKGFINASVTMLIYKPLVKALKATRLIDGKDSGKADIRFSIIAACAVIIVSCILGILIIAGVL